MLNGIATQFRGIEVSPPWSRIGLVLGYNTNGQVLVFWGIDFPYEEEYPDQLTVI